MTNREPKKSKNNYNDKGRVCNNVRRVGYIEISVTAINRKSRFSN